ncbi:MAG: tRNA 2-selenouridine(34) synthase MnmH [Desulfuromonadales bacterium]|nr:tRNA 2-selenouridine(34) synthase MnmH [Desulfuromonadales bacterium]NIS42832.1 tRNA 2-selenouridine(34) synthase MnmH [Desulfuromonadales bacterium]
MNKTVTLEKALDLREQGALFVDARSPSEYAEAHVPRSVNVPILDDEERSRVGTLYKQEGSQAARRLGVEIVSPKIPALIEQVAAVRPERRLPVVVYCWRGGMRSRALTDFLNLAGIEARQMLGGHKAFRAHVREFFAEGELARMLVLRGLTGVGKTRILKQLEAEGYPVLDLEGLANHRGSAFGGLGLPAQPGQKHFESLLWDALKAGSPQGYFLTEGESRNIGRCKQPDRLFEALQAETTLWINAGLDFRTEVILEDYPAADELRRAFEEPIRALKRRLGKQTVEHFLDLLKRGEWRQLVRELMEFYYDPLYNHTKPEDRIEIDIEPFDEGIDRLKSAIDQVAAKPPK